MTQGQGANKPLEAQPETQEANASPFSDVYPGPGGKVQYARSPESPQMALFPGSDDLLKHFFNAEQENVGRGPVSDTKITGPAQDLSAAQEAGAGRDAVHPFSAQDIENAGKQNADELSRRNLQSGESNYNILKMDNPEQLQQDIDAYKKAGGMGGVQQGELDDCWFQVSVAALAGTAEGREKLSQMITAAPDGGYTVTFPGDKEHPVTVSSAEVNSNRAISDSAEWARALEAAVLKLRPKNTLPVEEGGTGGNVGDGMKLLTGSEIIPQMIESSSSKDIVSSISEGLKDGKPVIATSNPDAAEPLVESHAYNVMGYDENSNSVILRNPWGYNDIAPGVSERGITAQGAGLINMPLDQFMKDFHILRTTA